MTQGQINISNAPRDADKLQILGPFMLKRLMELGCEQLNVQFDETKRNAFLRLSIDQRAKDVLEVLQEVDKRTGGAPAPAQEAPAQQPAAQAAPAATEDKPARTPVTRGGKANGTTNGTSGGHPTTEDGIAALQGIAAVIKEVSGTVDAMSKTIKTIEAGSKKVEALEAKIESCYRLQNLTLGVLLQIAEGTLNAPPEQVLEAVASEFGRVQPIIEKLVSGK